VIKNTFIFLSLVLTLTISQAPAADGIVDFFAKIKAAIGKTGEVDLAGNCSQCQNRNETKNRVSGIIDSKENNETVTVTVLSSKEAEAIFNELASNQKIPFGYAYDGCYARAAKMSKILEEKGIISGKAFVEGNLNVVSPVLGDVHWWYHVAPVILVKIDDKEIPYVIDPSLFKKPVPFSEWRDSMTGGDKTHLSREYFTNRFSYSPDDKNPPPKTSYSLLVEINMQSTLSDYSKKYEMIVLSKTPGI
jgi:hypothetical protein